MNDCILRTRAVDAVHFSLHIRRWCRQYRSKMSPPNIRPRLIPALPSMNEDQRIAACKTAITQIYTMLRSSPQQWRSFLALARATIASLDSTTLMQQAARTPEQVWITTALQLITTKDVENGAVADIASWCSRQWLLILQRDSQNLAALRGLGQMWLSRAQPSLARIHAGQSRAGSESATEAERRVGAAEYVEARGILQPAVEYLEKAVAAASKQSALAGDLLAKVGSRSDL